MSEPGDANILTFLRVRPSKAASGYFRIDEMKSSVLHFNLPESYKPASDYVNNTKLHYGYVCQSHESYSNVKYVHM